MNIKDMVAESFATAKAHGWWEDATPNVPEKLALIHSEVSEALESFRNGEPLTSLHYFSSQTGVDTPIPYSVPSPIGRPMKPEGFPSELADVLIRIADLCGYYGIDLEAAVVAKLEYNKTRPFRHGGKTC